MLEHLVFFLLFFSCLCLCHQVVALPLPAATFEPELYPERTELSLTHPIEVTGKASRSSSGISFWMLRSYGEGRGRVYTLELDVRSQTELTVVRIYSPRKIPIYHVS